MHGHGDSSRSFFGASLATNWCENYSRWAALVPINLSLQLQVFPLRLTVPMVILETQVRQARSMVKSLAPPVARFKQVLG